uniref:Pentacotripeptide-repeat region of PRORP domain-containing protein n=1 Tax=Leersia perrieri TaxID=77586 RepID=A0A0D9XZ32_9ORYZ
MAMRTARSAAARLLSSSAAAAAAAPPLRTSRRRGHPSLLPSSRSKTTTTTSKRPPRKDGGGGGGGGRHETGRHGPRPSLFQELSGLVADDPAFQPRRDGQERCGVGLGTARCTEGVRRIVPEGAASGSASGSVSNTDGLGFLSNGGIGPRSSVTGAASDDKSEVSIREAGEGNAVDVEDISEVVHRVTEVLRSEVAGSSVEQRLEILGVTYTPRLVSMVLNRCFKKKHLGFKFFDWVRRAPGFRHTTETYNTMLYIAGEERNFGAMEKLMGEMDKEMCLKDIKTWTIVISSYGKARQIGKMLSTYQAMRKLRHVAADSKVYRTILHALCNSAKPELALEFYKDMPRNMEVGSDIYRLLMCCLAGSDNAEAVFYVRDDMIKSMKYPEEYCYLEALRSFCVSGKIEEAQKVFQQMVNNSIANSPAFEILLRGLCKGGRMDKALQVMEYMKSKSAASSAAFGSVIDGYLRKGERMKALKLLQEMKEYGCVPLASSYTQLMQHLFAFDQHDAACRLYDEMQDNGIEPDVVTITALIGGHVRSGHISEAWDAFRKINENGQRPTLKAYTVFIQELCKASRPLEALKLLNEMLESDFRPSEQTFSRIIFSLRDNHYLEEASNIQRMQASFSPREELQCRTLDQVDYTDKIKKISRSGPEEKERTLESVGHPLYEDREVTGSLPCDGTQNIEQEKDYNDEDFEQIYQILLSSECWSSVQQALEMASLSFTPNLVDAVMKRCKANSRAALQFFSWVGKRSYYKQTTKTYNTAIKLAGSAKDFKHMRHLYREMAWAECCPTVDTWNVMICQYGNAGLTEMALETFYKMKQCGFLPDKTTYNRLIMYLSRRKGRKVDAAIKIFHEMCHAGCIPDNGMVCTYISALCECGMIDHAKSSVVLLCKHGFSIQAGYSILIRSLCRSDKIAEALSLFDNIEKYGCSRSAYMYGSLTQALLRKDRFEDAAAMLADMKNLGIPQSTHMYTSFMIYYLGKRDVSKAMDVLKEMIDNGCEPTVVTYSALIRGHMAMGMVSEAWDVFQNMKLKGPAPDFETYSMFMSCLCKAGKSEDGLQLIHDMLDSGIIPSAVNFRTVVHGLNVEGKYKLADSVLRSKWHLRSQRTFSDSLVADSCV